MSASLAECVKHHVRYGTVDEKGETRADRNARFGMSHLTPDDPDVPLAVEHVWVWFWRLSAQRSNGMGGPDPIGWLHIRAWSDLTGTQVLPEEAELIVAMDHAYRKEVSDEQRAKRDAETTGAKWRRK